MTTTSNVAKEMQDLHEQALREGGTLVVYAGGDSKDMFDFAKYAFEQSFPGMKVTFKVDLSKFHGVELDRQLASGELEPSVTHLQTLHDFDRWKEQGHLAVYRPLGSEKVYDVFKDPDGAWHGIFVIAFSHFINVRQVPENEIPGDAPDFLKPRFRGRLVFTYPNDDDAVLFAFKRIVDKYGWRYMERLMDQGPTFVRGLPAAQAAVESGNKDATFAAFGPLVLDPKANARFMLPKTDPFSGWAQTAAMFKRAPHPAAAKLYLSWWLSAEVQRYWPQWSVRTDVDAPVGPKSIFETKADPEAFRAFMRDRAELERFRFAIERYVGPVEGPSPV